MPWISFFAGRDDLLALLHFAAEASCRIFEVSPRFDQEPREFANAEAAAALPNLGVQPLLHLALWSPAVGPAPVTRRIELRPDAVPGHAYRITLEGCSLITLSCGGISDGMLVASALGWWTEAGARAKASPDLHADAVDWKQLASLGRRLRYHLTRRLSATVVERRPVLPAALAFARAGGVLRDPAAPTVEFRVAAA